MDSIVCFSMGDLQEVWENGGQNAYFAKGDLVLEPARTPGSGKVYTGPGGPGFMTGEKNLEKAAKRGEKAEAKAARKIAKQEKMAQKGIKLIKKQNKAGKTFFQKMLVNVGKVGKTGLGRAISKDKRIAGGVILGTTALGVGGGGYALTRRNNN